MAKSSEQLQDDYNKSYAQTRGHSHVHGTNIRVGPSSGSGGGSGTGSNRNGCFPAGTYVLTPTGRTPIELVSPGQQVMAFDAGRGRIVTVTVLHARRYANRRLAIIRFRDGSLIRTTAAHSFRTDDGWRKAGDLVAGDRLKAASGAGHLVDREVASVQSPEESADVFNLITAGPHTFFADGTLVHSFTRLRAWRSLLCTLSAAIRRAVFSRVDACPNQPAPSPAI